MRTLKDITGFDSLSIDDVRALAVFISDDIRQDRLSAFVAARISDLTMGYKVVFEYKEIMALGDYFVGNLTKRFFKISVYDSPYVFIFARSEFEEVFAALKRTNRIAYPNDPQIAADLGARGIRG